MTKRKKKAWSRGSSSPTSTFLLTPEQAAKYLGITTRTLANWRSIGFPRIAYIKVGRCVRYHPDELDGYIIKNSHNIGGGE